MPPAKRRKLSPATEAQDSITQEDSTGSLTQSKSKWMGGPEESYEAGPSAAPTVENPPVDKNKERQERFKALQARAVR